MFFRRESPDAHIVAVEPDPSNFALLARNVRGMDNVTIIEAAIAPAAGRVHLGKAALSWGSSLALRGPGVTVDARTLEEILDTTGISTVDLLKVDIEGAEYDLIESFTEWHRIRTVVFELHPYFARADVDVEAKLSATHSLQQIKTLGDELLVGRRREP